ncbi:uncharacterized protein LOC143239104 [Tachypleus tridentatus]|uniref:uncharacterized protein LOC143239104 n=1 Tax=Tachypleus tridentatus TaxID=6853 RepID=UPI003FD4577C
MMLMQFSSWFLMVFVRIEFSSAETSDVSPPVPFIKRIDIVPTPMKIGATCRSSLVCLMFIPNSFCDWNSKECKCRPYHVLYNETACLPPSLLGFGCAIDEQCQLKVKDSECVEGLCQCQHGFLPLRRDKCLPPAKVDEYCLNPEQCRIADKYTYCDWIIPRIYGKCRCPLGFLYTEDNRCLPHLGNKCKSSRDCEEATPDSLCRKLGKFSVCTCRPGFTPSKNRLRCRLDEKHTETMTLEETDNHPNPITVVSLGKQCTSTVQCQTRDPFSMCEKGICQCIFPTSKCSTLSTGCHNDTFQCRSGACISWYFVCDGQKNCADGSDEDECTPHNCPKESFQCKDGKCISRRAVCNGKWECPDGSDEAQCYRGVSCDKNSFQCSSGQCLPQHSFCNAVTDCLDKSDETPDLCDNGTSCPSNSFRCSNGNVGPLQFYAVD